MTSRSFFAQAFISYSHPLSAQKQDGRRDCSRRPSCYYFRFRQLVAGITAFRFRTAAAAPSALAALATTAAAWSARTTQLSHIDIDFLAFERFELSLLVARQLGHDLLVDVFLNLLDLLLAIFA